MRRVITKAGVLALLLLAGCAEERWAGFVNPGNNDRRTTFTTGTYRTLAECRGFGNAMLRSVNAEKKGDYWCESNCRTLSPLMAKLLMQDDGKLCFGLPGKQPVRGGNAYQG